MARLVQGELVQGEVFIWGLGLTEVMGGGALLVPRRDTESSRKFQVPRFGKTLTSKGKMKFWFWQDRG